MRARYLGQTVLVTTMLAVSAASAQSQVNLQQRVSIDVNAVSPHQVLEMIARAVDCTVVVDPQVVVPVTIRVSRVTARTALNAVCESVGCRWQLDGKTLRVDAEPAERTQSNVGAGKQEKPRLSDPLPSGEPVYEIGNGVTAPVVQKEVRPQYTRAAMEARIHGQVVLEFVVLRARWTTGSSWRARRRGRAHGRPARKKSDDDAKKYLRVGKSGNCLQLPDVTPLSVRATTASSTLGTRSSRCEAYQEEVPPRRCR